jgi:hypothetical protein
VLKICRYRLQAQVLWENNAANYMKKQTADKRR